MSFRARLFLASFAATAAAVLVATALLSWSVRRATAERTERDLVAETRLAAALLELQRGVPREQLDAEADALARVGSARVTFIAPDGTVVGDSDVAFDLLPQVENHGSRPEIVAARTGGVGTARRTSATVGAEMLYAAAAVSNPDLPDVAAVRLAVPLTHIAEQLAVLRRMSLAGLVVGLVGAAAFAWMTSEFLARRMRAIGEAARRYAGGDFSRPSGDQGPDEIGTVARVLDDSVRELGRRAADRALLEAILTGMIEGVLVVNHDGRVQLVNAAAQRMLRITDPSEGRHYLEIIRHPDIVAQLGAALRGEAAEPRELKLPQAAAATFVARSAPVAAAGTRAAVLVLHDITGLRRADQIRRDFVANVSHELRTPLTAVRGYVEALLDGVTDADQSRTFLETIARHTQRMERLVRDLLRLARLDAGQETVERVPCAIEGLFAGVEADLAGVLEARRLTVVRDIGPGAGTVAGDPAKLHDALRNLLENAANYSPHGGTIQLESRRVADRIRMTVADEGPGIPEADLTRVFERFYRVDKARSRAGTDPGGTGLGLAIVRHLVELHGGTVAAANRRDGGAVMTVELPFFDLE